MDGLYHRVRPVPALGREKRRTGAEIAVSHLIVLDECSGFGRVAYGPMVTPEAHVSTDRRAMSAGDAAGPGGVSESGPVGNGRSVPQAENVTFRQVMRHRHFRNIWAAQFISNIGTWIEAFALQMWVANVTGRLDDQGWLAALQLTPIAVLGIVGGLVADRVNRRTLLVVTQLIAALVAAAVAVVSMIYAGVEGPDDPRARQVVTWVFVLGAVNGCVMAFNFPAWQVLTPRLVPRNELTRAIALNGIQFNLARMIGPALGGLVLARYSGTPLFAFNAVTFVLMAWVVMRTPDAPGLARDGRAVWRQVAEAWQFIWRSRGPRAVFLAQVIISLLAAPLVRLLPLYTIDVYGLDAARAATAAGVLLAIQGVGAVAGGLALGLIPGWYPKHHFIPVAVTALGVTIALFSMTTGLWAGYAVMLVCGFFWIWSFNQSWAAMQMLAPDSMRGRVLSLTTMASFGATAAGAAVAGLAGEALKLHAVLDAAGATQLVVAMLGVPLMLGGIVMLLVRTPEVDGMPRLSTLTRRQRWSIMHAVLATEHRPRRNDPTEPLQADELDVGQAETRATRGM